MRSPDNRLDKLKPDIPAAAKAQALRKILKLPDANLLENNRLFHMMLTAWGGAPPKPALIRRVCMRGAALASGFPALETSMMLHWQPHLVDMSKAEDHSPARFPLYDLHPLNLNWPPPSGTLSSPQNASGENGKLIIEVSRTVQSQFGV